MRKHYLLLCTILLTITLTASFSSAQATGYRYQVDLKECDTSVIKQFEIQQNKDIVITVCNDRSSTSWIEYTLTHLADGDQIEILKLKLDPSKSGGHRWRNLPEGSYSLKMTSSGSCRVTGFILDMDRPPTPSQNVSTTCCIL